MGLSVTSGRSVLSSRICSRGVGLNSVYGPPIFGDG
jgi:hypothetical protein